MTNFIPGQILAVQKKGVRFSTIDKIIAEIGGKITRTVSNGSLASLLITVPEGTELDSCKALEESGNFDSAQPNYLA